MNASLEVNKLDIYLQASDFFRRCSSFLCEQEAQNNLILGIGGILGTPTSPYKDFFLASVGSTSIEGAFLMTPPHKMIVSSPASERSMQLVIDKVASTSIPISGVNGPSTISEQFADFWTSTTGQDVKLSTNLFCYKLSSVQPITFSSGSTRLATQNDFELLVRWSHQFDIDAGVHQREDSLIRNVVKNGIEEGHYYLWVDEQPVSLVRTSGTTPSGIRISSVYTPLEHRGRGYASSLVAQVSELQLAGGKRFCFLFTDATNLTSNKIYQCIGYEKVCGFQEYSFQRSR